MKKKDIVPTIIVLDKKKIVLKCKYCARMIDINEIEEI